MRRIVSVGLSIAAFAILGLVTVPEAHAGHVNCSKGLLSGSYSAAINGNLAGAPLSELDLVTANGDGTFSGSGTVSEDGAISSVSFTATYTINADCSGSAVLSTGVTQNLNISTDGSQVWFISTNSGANITGTATRLTHPKDGQ